MPQVVNKSVRIYVLNAGMVPPGGTIEVPQEEFETDHFQNMLASGELVEERDQKRVQAAEQKVQKAEQQVEKAQQDVQKASQQVEQTHAKIAEQRTAEAAKAAEQRQAEAAKAAEKK